jgi:hypothetical protein
MMLYNIQNYPVSGNQHDIRTIFRTKHTLRSSLVKTRLERDPQQMAQCFYRISCECSRSYIGEISRPLAMWLCEHLHNFKEHPLENSKLAQHACEEDHRLITDEARILENESNSRYRKYKESAHMVCLTNPISQSSLYISPTCIPIISNKVTNSKISF